MIGLLTAVLLTPSVVGDGMWTKDYPASNKPGELVVGVTYFLWLPENIKTIRGVIVHQHGCGAGAEAGGKTAANDWHWQALARKWDCALLGSSYHAGDKVNCRLWCDPRNGSEQTFLRALADCAKERNHPELATCPWALWGHSGGGFWASLMCAKFPERIVAAWLRSGTAFGAWEKGDVPKPTLTEACFTVPIMLNPGKKEKDDKRFHTAWSYSMDMFHAYRRKGAPIGFAFDPNTGHECGDSRYLAIRFFDICLAQRLPAPGADIQCLRPVDFSTAWLGDIHGKILGPAALIKTEIHACCWLPDQAYADAWSAYLTSGKIDDTTKPPKPANVVVKPTAEGVEIRWQAVADLESGIRAFVIERDGEKIAQTPEKPIGRFGAPLFQTMSYHDTPEGETPALRYVDRSAKPNARYRVRTVNTQGLISEP